MLCCEEVLLVFMAAFEFENGFVRMMTFEMEVLFVFVAMLIIAIVKVIVFGTVMVEIVVEIAFVVAIEDVHHLIRL